ncbi:MAG: molybdopterin-dependent oxidoreductase [Chloroflexi bacterium]|nr:molybdopterin-dependent oxidoreductase [Chloroflexota bacterium]
MATATQSRVVRTVCPTSPYCLGGNCPIWVTVEGGRITHIRPVERGRICARGLAWQELIYSPKRVPYPLRRVGERGGGKWERISWDEALDTIVQRLKDIRGRYGSRSVGFKVGGFFAGCGGPAARLFANLFDGCMVGGLTTDSTVGYRQAAGGPVGPGWGGLAPGGHALEDLEMNSNLIILWGANPAETAQRKFIYAMKAQERGAKLIAIDPVYTISASKADQWLPIKPGSDGALVLAMLHVIHTEELGDWQFMQHHSDGPFLVREDNRRFLRESDVLPGGRADRTLVWDRRSNGARPTDAEGLDPALLGRYVVAGIACAPAFQLLLDEASKCPPERAEEITGIPAEAIRTLAREYATTKPAAVWSCWGINRYEHSDLIERGIMALAALSGNIGIPGGGVTSEPAFVSPPVNHAAFTVPGRKLPLLDGYAMMNIGSGQPVTTLDGNSILLKALVVNGGNNFVNNQADQGRLVREVLPQIEFIVVSELLLNETARYADIVLPAASHFERETMLSATFYNDSFHYCPKVIEPVDEARGELDMFNELGRRMGWGEHFQRSEAQVIETLLETVPGINLERLKREQTIYFEGYQPGSTPEHPHVHFEDKVFGTSSGRLEFYAERLAELGEHLPVHKERPGAESSPFKLTLIGLHTRDHVGTIYTNSQWLRQQDPEPVLEIHPQDARTRGIGDGAVVYLYNELGRVKLRAKLSERPLPGVVGVAWGWEAEHFMEGSVNYLLHSRLNPAHVIIHKETGATPNTPYFDIWVEVENASGNGPFKSDQFARA